MAAFRLCFLVISRDVEVPVVGGDAVTPTVTTTTAIWASKKGHYASGGQGAPPAGGRRPARSIDREFRIENTYNIGGSDDTPLNFAVMYDPQTLPSDPQRPLEVHR